MYLGNSARDVPSEIYVVGVGSPDVVVATLGYQWEKLVLLPIPC